MSELEALANGEMDATEARPLLAELLSADDTRMPRKIYNALVRLAYTMLAERRFGDELRSWHRLIKDISARLSLPASDGENAPIHSDISIRLEGLADLVKVAASRDDEIAQDVTRLMTRAHVPEILTALQRAHPTPLERSVLAGQLEIKTANLSRVLGMLSSGGLVARKPAGRSIIVSLTLLGEKLAPKTSGPLTPAAEAIQCAAVPEPLRAGPEPVTIGNFGGTMPAHGAWPVTLPAIPASAARVAKVQSPGAELKSDNFAPRYELQSPLFAQISSTLPGRSK